MASATIKLENGTAITVSGSAEEIAKIVMLYGSTSSPGTNSAAKPKQQTEPSARNVDELGSEADLSTIANTINDCNESDALDEYVLDNPNVMNRVIMCLYINEKYFDSLPQLTTGEISKILKQLGVPVSTPNVSITISRKAKSYVMADSVRTKGAVVRYAINRRGLKYFEEILSGNSIVAHKSVQTRASRPKSRAKKGAVSDKVKEPPLIRKGASVAPKNSGALKPKYNATLNLLGLVDFAIGNMLKNNSEYVVTFIQFLNEKLNHSPINSDDIYTCFFELKSVVKLPGSFRDTLRNAQNRDHLISYSQGFTNIELTPKGENLFHHDIVKRNEG